MHEHIIVDSDVMFSIDSITRSISTESEKLSLVQYDHNSERYTFQLPQLIENHDMSLCNRIEVHYTNLTRNKRSQNDDVYLVPESDISYDGDTLSFSWLVSRNATQLVGSLKFSITFICVDDEGNNIYQWSTTTFDGIQILTKFEHVQKVLDNYPDLIEELKRGAVDTESVNKIIKEYMAANPPAPGQDGEDGKSAYEIALDKGFEGTEEEWLESLIGADGEPGEKGEPGNSGVYYGSGEAPEECDVQIDPDGDVINIIEAPSKAEVGQMLVVKAVDENGVPTEWEVSNVASGGSEDIPTEPIIDVTLEEDVAELIISTDKNGNTFDLSQGYMLVESTPLTGNTANGDICVRLGTNTTLKYLLSVVPKETDTKAYSLFMFMKNSGKVFVRRYKSFNYTNMTQFLQNAQTLTNGIYTLDKYGNLIYCTEITRFHILANIPNVTKIVFAAGSRIRVWGK